MRSSTVRQPNDLLCHFSFVVDTITDYNLIDEEYIEMCVEKAREEAKEVSKYHIRPPNCIKEQLAPNNTSSKEFKQIIKKMETLRKWKKYSIALHLHYFCFTVAKAITTTTTDLFFLQLGRKNAP